MKIQNDLRTDTKTTNMTRRYTVNAKPGRRRAPGRLSRPRPYRKWRHSRWWSVGVGRLRRGGLLGQWTRTWWKRGRWTWRSTETECWTDVCRCYSRRNWQQTQQDTSLCWASILGSQHDATRIADEHGRRRQISIDSWYTAPDCPQGTQQQTSHMPLLPSIDRTDNRTDGHLTVHTNPLCILSGQRQQVVTIMAAITNLTALYQDNPGKPD